MNNSILKRLMLAVIAALPLAAAQANEPIRLIVPFGPGSGTDLIARTLAKAVTEETGTPVIVDNKPGGEGFIGSRAAATAAPDGRTLLMAGSSTQVVNAHLFKKLPYDPVKDFVPVTPIARTSMLLTVNANLPAKNATELMQLAKAKPGVLSVGSGSATTRLVGQYFMQQAGIKMLDVPYKTPASAVTDLMGDQVNVVFIDLPTVAGHLQNGKLRALAVTGRQRMQAQPNVPTLQEAGLKDFDITAWYGIWAPAGTPSPIAAQLNATFSKAMASPSVKAFFTNASMETFGAMTPADFQKFQADETAKIGRIVKAAGIEAQ
ncbi:Putative extracytoplasmic tricarboxylate-binding receptor of a tripartite transporter, in cluster with DUF1446 [plant metagenome]|uniref:Extracytoplasmic tricarboxylate-binding receptor of a tripartite transporter, in cluster with DUF1446 n=1 Tax=plant metagenome TaxID=1297885 RepID=A0A484RCA8_9ZZZZ